MFNFKKSFTLTEIMIALTVIGVITAVVMPIAYDAMPNDNVIKFKKAHATFYQVIGELVTSDKYFCNGDLGLLADCTTLNRRYTLASGDYVFDGGNAICRAMADVLSVKENKCSEENAGIGGNGHYLLSNEQVVVPDPNNPTSTIPNDHLTLNVTSDTIAAVKVKFDSACKQRSVLGPGPEIITTDGVAFFQTHKGVPFGGTSDNKRYFSPPGQNPPSYADQNGFDIAYKVFCIDIDGVPTNATASNCKNECPFGYGVRADGQILAGARAEEWLEKTVQQKD